jgi:DNA-binding Lrp family transcriptional regulator
LPQKNNNLEQKALKLVFDAGDKGIFQSEIWKKLGVSSREGSRMAKKFEEKDKVIREKVLNDGRWTYKLYSKKELVTLDSVKGCPCLICDEVDKCFRGGTRDPVYCMALTAWIDPRIEIEVNQ